MMQCVKMFPLFFLLISCSHPKEKEEVPITIPSVKSGGGSWQNQLDQPFPSVKMEEGNLLKIKLQNPAPFTEDSFTHFLIGLNMRLFPEKMMAVQFEAGGEGNTFLRASMARADWEAYAKGEISKPEWSRRLGVETVDTLESIRSKTRTARGEGRLDEVSALLLKWLTLEPNSTVALSILGNVYRDEKKWGDAVQVYQKILAADSRSVFALHNLGTVYAEQGAYADSIVNYSKAIELEPANPVLARQLALSYRQNGDLSSAQTWIAKSLALSETPEARVIEGNILRDGKKFKEAGEVYAKAAVLSPADARVLFNQILIDLDLKNFDEAKKKFKELQAKDPAMAEELKIVSIF